MLTKIYLKNFKSFLDAAFELKPLTVLTGLNSSGKSSVIQAINMLGLCYQKQTIALLEHAAPHMLKSRYSKDTTFEITVNTDSNDAYTFHVFITSENYTWEKRGTETKLPFDIQYISASRLGPQNALPTNPEASFSEVGSKGEYVIDFIEKNCNQPISDNLVKDTKGIVRLKENINAWLQYISPGTSLNYEINRLQNSAYPYYNDFVPTESGFGLSYTLPVITALLAPSSKKDTILLLENPEAHLHPQGQTAMGELIARCAASGKQIIAKTHSDHVIDGIRIAARRKQISNTDVTFHYVSKENLDTPSTVETPNLLPDGKLSFWPRGFFDQNMLNKAELLKK
jgi:predicted ATPase